MIKLEKKVIYYMRKKYHHSSTIKKETFYNIDEALETFENNDPVYYKNDRDISAYEETRIYIPTEYGMKCYYKKVDPVLETIETNYIKD